MEILEKLKNDFKVIEESFKKDLSSLNLGRSSPALIENILVDYLGSKIPVKQLASISSPESRILVVEPWDKASLPNLEKAILNSNIGLSPIIDKNLIRINIPPLTEERKLAILKVLNSKIEETKIKYRNVRDKAIKELNALFDLKKITEDEKFKNKEKIQELIDLENKNLETLFVKKEKEIKEK